MDDLISRQALLKTLNENKIEFDSDVNYFIMHAPSVNQWIPCSEKMPDKFGMYWVCTKGGYQVQAELTVNMGGHVEEPLVVWNLPFGYPKTEVVAWMPLPEPWKGE